MATEKTSPSSRRATIVPVVMLVCVLLGLAAGGYYLRHAPLWVVNGLDLPVVVEIDGARREIGPGERSSSWTSTGMHRVRVLTREGAVIDEGAFWMEEAGSNALHVVNVLGAAPVYVETVEYTRRTDERTDKERKIEFLGGRPFASRYDVDYVFEAPPQSLSTKSYSGNLLKTHADVAPGGWRSTAGYFSANQQPDVAASLARAVSRAQPGDPTARAAARHFTEAMGGEVAGAALAAAWRNEMPRDEEVHRGYQNTMMRLDRTAEVIDEYRTLYAAGDKGPEATSLLARVLPPSEARGVLDEALGRHPEAPLLLLYKGLIETFELRHAEADVLFTRAEASPSYVYFVEEHAVALVALGRVKEAAERLSRVTEKSIAEKQDDLVLAVAYARVAELAPAEAPVPAWTYVDRLAAQPNGAWRGLWARSLLGKAPVASMDDRDTADVVHIHHEAGESAAKAWSACASAGPEALRRIDATVAILLGTELARAGDMDMAERLLAPRRELQTPWRALVDHVITGAETPGLGRLSPEHRAALDFVRARALQAAGQPADVLLESAARRDVLRGVVTRAMARWPAVKPAVKPVVKAVAP
ncbi:uncharacterized protein SOCE26_079430 [Sorangium cellulosum]|uniref:Uncharacterized protein n=1 Tax=Sorangium cellulosum TaxID=56 RepID=A0A2L0F4H6_SORCE|nr:hypothetical protein [Sorangium cellulosum]AUX46437.1 uncharacterized protein SOCE26_079430 [Sorangium cellulosum]